MTTTDSLLSEVSDGIALFTINRPDAMNSVNGELATALGYGLKAANENPDVSVIVITGAGDRAFCAGMDLKAFAAGEPVEPEGHPEWGFAGVTGQWSPKPVIAAVNGVALGGGAELALSADLIVADETASFGLPEALRGLVAAGGGLLRIAQQLPQRIANELIFTGRRMTAPEAAEWGLINRVVPQGSALEKALELAAHVVKSAPLALQASKQLMRETLSLDSWGEEAWAKNREVLDRIFATADAAEGARAFAEKREPVWRAK